MNRMMILLSALLLALPAVAEINWAQSKQNSQEVLQESAEGVGRAWDKTVDNSAELWEDTKRGSKKVWEHTKEQGSGLADDLKGLFEDEAR